LGADFGNRLAQVGRAGLPAIGADVELRQLALEQARDMAADRMRVIEHDAAMAGAQAGDFGASAA
jgi:hypothetical protein